MNKKGIIPSLLYIIVALLIIGIVASVVIVAWKGFSDAINDSPTLTDTQKEEALTANTIMDYPDKIMAGLVVILWISLLITSATMRTENAAFFIIFAFFLVFITFISMILSNTFEKLDDVQELREAKADIPITTYLIAYQPMIAFLFGLSAGIVFYMRSRDAGFNSGGGDMFE